MNRHVGKHKVGSKRPGELKGVVTPEKALYHARILSNSLKKNYRHFSRRYRKAGIECFRLYDWDTSEVRIVVDWYAGHIVVAEYERLQTGAEYLPQMAEAAALALNVSMDKVHMRRRHTKLKEGPRYSKIADKDERMEVRERDLKFLVNLTDFLDTGLYSDHRETRNIIRKMADGKDFLNLFAYTGAFTCAAALGNARSTVTVDRSLTYINWVKDNLELNGLWDDKHKLVQSDVMKYLERVHKEGKKFDLAFVDPPSFFKEEMTGRDFDINRDHPQLLNSVLKLMKPGGDILFSTNHQRFTPRYDELKVKEIISLTPKTIPEDYRNRNIHHCWHIKC